MAWARSNYSTSGSELTALTEWVFCLGEFTRGQGRVRKREVLTPGIFPVVGSSQAFVWRQLYSVGAGASGGRLWEGKCAGGPGARATTRQDLCLSAPRPAAAQVLSGRAHERKNRA
jgi:hypothetical protein